MWLFRYIDRAADLVRRRSDPTTPKTVPSAIASTLQSVLESDALAVDRIVCFDVFDLPAVMTLADAVDIPVVVR